MVFHCMQDKILIILKALYSLAPDHFSRLIQHFSSCDKLQPHLGSSSSIPNSQSSGPSMCCSFNLDSFFPLTLPEITPIHMLKWYFHKKTFLYSKQGPYFMLSQFLVLFLHSTYRDILLQTQLPGYFDTTYSYGIVYQTSNKYFLNE